MDHTRRASCDYCCAGRAGIDDPRCEDGETEAIERILNDEIKLTA
jgi:hypothetical protein